MNLTSRFDFQELTHGPQLYCRCCNVPTWRHPCHAAHPSSGPSLLPSIVFSLQASQSFSSTWPVAGLSHNTCTKWPMQWRSTQQLNRCFANMGPLLPVCHGITLRTSEKINFSYYILLHLITSYSSYFGGKKGISGNKTSFF